MLNVEMLNVMDFGPHLFYSVMMRGAMFMVCSS